MTTAATFQAIQDQLGGAFRERENAIEAIILASLAGENSLLVGPPGTGKSMLFRSFLSHFSDARTFDTLVTKFSTEDSLFGPVKLSALKEDRWERATTGKLAAVEAAFLDEFFKASDAALNTMLTAINERRYSSASIPLRMTVAASNELPQDDGLAAIYDRFVVREVVEYIASEDTWVDLLVAPPCYSPAPGTTLTVAEWDSARAEVSQVSLSEKTVRALAKVRKALAEVGVVASDRRWIAMCRVLRASAWLDGRDYVGLDDFRVLAYGLWTNPDDRSKVKAALDAIDAGPAKKAIEAMDVALTRYHNRPTEPAALRAVRAEIAAELTKAAQTVDAIVADGVSSRTAEKIALRRAELSTAYEALTKAMAAGLGGGLGAFAKAGQKAKSAN